MNYPPHSGEPPVPPPSGKRDWGKLFVAGFFLVLIAQFILMLRDRDKDREREQLHQRAAQLQAEAERAHAAARTRAAQEREQAAFASLDAEGHLRAALQALGPADGGGIDGVPLAERHLDAIPADAGVPATRVARLRAEIAARQRRVSAARAQWDRDRDRMRRQRAAGELFQWLIEHRFAVEAVEARGPEADSLWVQWVSCDYVRANDIAALPTVRAARFRRLDCERTYTHRTYSLTLNP